MNSTLDSGTGWRVPAAISADTWADRVTRASYSARSAERHCILSMWVNVAPIVRAIGPTHFDKVGRNFQRCYVSIPRGHVRASATLEVLRVSSCVLRATWRVRRNAPLAPSARDGRDDAASAARARATTAAAPDGSGSRGAMASGLLALDRHRIRVDPRALGRRPRQLVLECASLLQPRWSDVLRTWQVGPPAAAAQWRGQPSVKRAVAFASES